MSQRDCSSLRHLPFKPLQLTPFISLGKMTPGPSPLVLAPSAKHTATVIFLHVRIRHLVFPIAHARQGLGQSASDWLPVVDTIKYTLPHVKWVLPNAPQRRVTVSLDEVRPAWFNIFSFDCGDAREDRQGLADSVRTIDGHVQDEIDGGIPAERIVVCGFSQGGATSLVVGLTRFGSEWKLGGVATLGSWLPMNGFREVLSLFMGYVTHR